MTAKSENMVNHPETIIPQPSSFGQLAGVDGCKGGWLMVHLGPGGETRTATWMISPHWMGLDTASSAFVAVDMPIGLPEGAADAGRRTCDSLARRLLPGAASTVFPTPRRPMLDAPDYASANAWGKARGAGLAKQAWFLIPRIRELDAALTPADQGRIRETHPELVFRALAGTQHLAPKKTPEGIAQRRAVLAAAGFDQLEAWRAALPRAKAAEDDLNDACVLALAARRMAEGTAICLSAAPQTERDARGLAMEIWY